MDPDVPAPEGPAGVCYGRGYMRGQTIGIAEVSDLQEPRNRFSDLDSAEEKPSPNSSREAPRGLFIQDA